MDRNRTVAGPVPLAGHHLPSVRSQRLRLLLRHHRPMCRMAAKHPDRKIPRPASRPLETLTKIAAQNLDDFLFMAYLLSWTVVRRMKSLERRNEDLQDRILELEDEARQRERQQAEQIQEIRNAYEQQHRKLSEFADFVRRYFPYVEKLIPVVNFLRERLGFNDGIIRRLCEFKEVGIKGKLYSSEFNRSFDTRHSVCSIKQDESGKFDFKIDGVSHVNWFRKKMNEFREAIGILKPRQDRGIKL